MGGPDAPIKRDILGDGWCSQPSRGATRQISQRFSGSDVAAAADAAGGAADVDCTTGSSSTRRRCYRCHLQLWCVSVCSCNTAPASISPLIDPDQVHYFSVHIVRSIDAQSCNVYPRTLVRPSCIVLSCNFSTLPRGTSMNMCRPWENDKETSSMWQWLDKRQGKATDACRN